jgi:hypothetical protein
MWLAWECVSVATWTSPRSSAETERYEDGLTGEEVVWGAACGPAGGLWLAEAQMGEPRPQAQAA